MAHYAPEMPARLAESAFRLFARQGIKSVNVERVARHAGVTKGSLYWHYKSKHELILAACSHYYKTYQRGINARLAGLTDPRQRLEQTVRQAVRTCLLDSENRVFTLEVFTLSLHDDEIRRSWRQFVDSVREFYIGLLQAVQAAGGAKGVDRPQAVNFMLDAMEGLKQRALYEPGICSPRSEQSIIENLLRILGVDHRKSKRSS